ncbi:MAG TPA: hypothetical protein VEB68_08535 [Croceibacterium sp.]|nr:hypothetical protein [Croceibacterium sp.]
MIRTLLVAACPLALAAIATPAAGKSSACPVAGHYWVAGKLPGADTVYRGEATISARRGACRMRWGAPNTSEGNGTYRDGVLTINFRFRDGSSGVVRYTRAANGDMHGVWWMDASPNSQGTETISPHGPPL